MKSHSAPAGLPTRQGAHRDRGFLMVALLIGMGVMAIMMTAVLPKWGTQVQRTREEELIFIGEQYARAIALYAIRNRGAYPMDVDALYSQKFLRKKWKDPVTGKDLQLIGIGIVQPGISTPVGGTNPQVAGTGRSGGATQVATTGQPGISGVRSTSTATSIKVYNQQQQHNLWAFDAQTYAMQKWQINLATLAGGGGRQGGGPGGARGGGAPGTDAGRGGQGQAPGRGAGPGGAGPGRGGGPPVAPPAGGAGPGRGRG